MKDENDKDVQAELHRIEREEAVSSNKHERAKPAKPQRSHLIKRSLWDMWSWPVRLGVIAGLFAIVFFGLQGAGTAAFGTAIGVDLWLVISAVGALIGVIVEIVLAIRDRFKK